MSGELTALPELRPELRLVKGAASFSGEPTWLIQDPVQNRYVQIDFASFETLAHWPKAASPEELIERVNANGRIVLDRPTLDKLVEFLFQSQLTTVPVRDGWRSYAAARDRQRHAPHIWLLHNYLFFRVPFWRPQAFLERTLQIARCLASAWVRRSLVLIGLAGLYLVSRQWEAYLSTYQDYVSPEGILLAGLTLAFIKSAHELGHAYTAVHFGCRVPTMGVAFMLLAPMLYTDVTDAWKLRDRRQRMHIDIAGVRVELAIAAVALFLWPFLPEGPLKGAAFMLSAISLITSLFINLNPFMRFDAYYLLSEALQVENLQPRAFAIGRWQLREWLFDLRHPCPEDVPRRLHATLVVYAYSVWVYRFFLFLGIALLVYHHFFKALGILLFAVEIVFFILKPIVSEVAMWLKLRNELVLRRRSLITGTAAALLVLLAVVPWSTRVEIPAVVEAGDLAHVFPPRPALVSVVHVEPGDVIAAGDPIVTLEAPDLALEQKTTEARLALARLQQARRGADGADLEVSLITDRSIASLEAKLAGVDREVEKLVVRAPISGRIVELDPELHAGRWIAPRERLATIVGGSHLNVRGYLAEADLWRIDVGTEGVFVPESAMFGEVPVVVARIAIHSAPSIDIEDLASVHGGLVATVASADQELVPSQSQFAVTLASAAPVETFTQALRGVVLADGAPESILSSTWRQVLSVLVRESGA